MFRTPYTSLPFCGCWHRTSEFNTKQYLPQVQLDSHTTILATTSKTVLRQTFHNPLDGSIPEVRYTFPLYDGVSVTGFTCTVAGRVVVGVVKERNQARVDYEDAKSKGQTAGLLEQSSDAADVFTTSIGNVPAGADVLVEIIYLGELKNDAETDGARFTIPTAIAPRYGSSSLEVGTGSHATDSTRLKITMDIMLEEGCAIRGIQSPSHPIAVSMGTISTRSVDDSFESNLGSATLALGSTELDKDFVVIISAKGQDTPRALLETHPTIPNHRALMTTLVPRFNIPNDNPEIIFVVDRSGSMAGKMHLVTDALKVFLKSLPVGVKFNICSFGSHHTFLFDKSRTYDAASLNIAMDHINPHSFTANYGGTEMTQPIQDLVQRRYTDLPLEVMLLTDGEIWNQESLFNIVNEASAKNARFFTLGIGSQASSALVEGVARAGRGFAQWVNDGERIDKRIVRMLKGALTPHIKYKLEIKYAQESADEDDFEVIESFEKSVKVVGSQDAVISTASQKQKVKKISLFNIQAQDEPTNPPAGRYDSLPSMAVPTILQTPNELPELYPHNRTSVYLLLTPETRGRTLEAVILRGSSTHGELELEIPVQDIGIGDTFHKLAAKKAGQELEEGRGWLAATCTTNGQSLKSQMEGKWDLIVEREAVRLGTTFQVAGKFCSFVAVEKVKKDGSPATQSVFEAPPAYDEEEEELGEVSVQELCLATDMNNFTANARSSGLNSTAPGSKLSIFGKSLEKGGSSNSPGGGYGGARKSSSVTPMFGMSSSAHSQARMETRSSGLFGMASRPFAALAASSPPPPPSAGPPPPAPAARRSLFSLPSSVTSFSTSKKKSVGDKTAAIGSTPDMIQAPGRPMRASYCFGAAQQQPDKAIETTDLSVLEKMQRLISLQSFTGSWTITNDLLAIVSHGTKIKIDKSEVKKLVTGDIMNQTHGDWVDDLNDDDCATVLAVAWLETVMREESDVWELVVEKARSSLESHIDGSDRIDKLLDSVRKIWKVTA